MRKDGKSVYSKVETILKAATSENITLTLLEFETIDKNMKTLIIRK